MAKRATTPAERRTDLSGSHDLLICGASFAGLMVARGMAGSGAWWRALAAAGPEITIYKSKSCGCCSKWVDHLEANGFKTVVHDRENMDEVKDWLGVPRDLRSCHTAQVKSYLVEGHVPAGDIQKLLAAAPKAAGLAVPGMPIGSPGMEVPGRKPDAYEVLSFDAKGNTAVFAKH